MYNTEFLQLVISESDSLSCVHLFSDAYFKQFTLPQFKASILSPESVRPNIYPNSDE